MREREREREKQRDRENCWDFQQAGNGALIQAAAKGHANVARLLIGAKASVTATNQVHFVQMA